MDTLKLNKPGNGTAFVADAAGNPTGELPDSPPAWALADPGFGTLSVAADGLSASIIPAKVGTMVVNVTGKLNGADISGSDSVQVTDVGTQFVVQFAQAPAPTALAK